MTTTQRQRPSGSSTPPPNTASRGVILVVVAIALGAILLFKGGGVGFEQDAPAVSIGSSEESGGADATTTSTTAAPSTSVAPPVLPVAVLNGAGINGYAGQAVQFLGVAGYTAATAGTAAAPVEVTTVYYAPGFEADAAAVASAFNLTPDRVQPLAEGTMLARNPEEQPDTTAVVVALGADVEPIVTSGAEATADQDATADTTG